MLVILTTQHLHASHAIFMFLSLLVTFCRIVIGLVFALSFLNKVLNPTMFERTVFSFDLVPKPLIKIAALLFLSGELTVVLFALAGGTFLGPGFTLAGILLLVFTMALASVLIRNIKTSCNCFGPSQKPVSAYDIWRNAGLILLVLAGLGALFMLNSDVANLDVPELSIVVLVAGSFVAIWLNLRDIIQLFHQR